MRPPVFNTPEELQEKIQEYLDNPTKKIKKHIKLKVGGNDKIEEVEVPVLTIGHLCYYLGFASRQSFYDYEKKDGFSYTIKRARLFIESEYEALLQVNPTGAIFALKNFGWKDKSEQEVYGKDGEPLNKAISVEIVTNEDKKHDSVPKEPTK